jgi:hypothetical protein
MSASFSMIAKAVAMFCAPSMGIAAFIAPMALFHARLFRKVKIVVALE